MSKNEKKNTGTSAGKESFFNILGESKSNARACTRRNPAGPESGPELDLPFLFIWEWNGTFANRPDFWFTFPYYPNFEPILDRFAWFVFIQLCECNVSPTGLLERTERTSINLHSWPCEGVLLYKICIWPIE